MGVLACWGGGGGGGCWCHEAVILLQLAGLGTCPSWSSELRVRRAGCLGVAVGHLDAWKAPSSSILWVCGCVGKFLGTSKLSVNLNVVLLVMSGRRRL